MSDKFASLARNLVGLVAGMALALPFDAASKVLAPRGNFHLVVFFALLLGEWLIAALIHELGHALAASFTGRRVHAIAVKPIVYIVKERKFKWGSGGAMRGLGGFVLATVAPGADSRRGEAVFALGGALANVASGAIALAIVGGRFLGRGPYPLIGTFAVLSLVVAVFSLVPIWGPGLRRSDGAILMDALRRRVNPGREHIQRLVAMHYDGVPVARWDAASVAGLESAAVHDPKLREVVSPMLFQYYFARNDFVRARAILAPLASPYPDAPAWIKLGEAFFLAHLDKNGVAAQKILDKLKPAVRKHFSYWLCLAVTRDCFGDRDGVRAAIAKTRAFAAKQKVTLDSDDLALLSALERRAERSPADEAASAA